MSDSVQQREAIMQGFSFTERISRVIDRVKKEDLKRHEMIELIESALGDAILAQGYFDENAKYFPPETLASIKRRINIVVSSLKVDLVMAQNLPDQA